MPEIKRREKELAREWFDMPFAVIVSKKLPHNDNLMAEYLGISKRTLDEWRKQHEKEKKITKIDPQAIQYHPRAKANFLDEIDPAKMSDQELFNHVVRALFGGLADERRSNRASEILARIKGFMAPEKQEVTHKLDAESLFEIRREAQRRLSEFNRETDRDRSLFEEQHILPQKIRQDKG